MGAWVEENGKWIPLGKKVIKSPLFHKRLLAKKLGLYPKKRR